MDFNASNRVLITKDRHNTNEDKKIVFLPPIFFSIIPPIVIVKAELKFIIGNKKYPYEKVNF